MLAGAIAYFLLSYVSITYDETIILWAISSQESGGLAMKQVHIGHVMSATGVILLLYTIYVYPLLAKFLGNMLGFRYGQFYTCMTFLLILISYYI